MYLPELVDSTPYGKMRLRDIMTHQAGLYPWIPFYLKTLKNGVPSSQYYRSKPDSVYNQEVAEDLWMRGDYIATMYDRILTTKLGSKTYKYSDLGYYFIKKIIEKNGGKSLDEYVRSTFYEPMGLRTMGYNPLKKYTKEVIPPTEDDHAFRQQIVHGYVHDQGASMMGGVGGHAGIFSNATDLASMMQMFLNNGSYGGVRYVDSSVIVEYTRCQNCPRNRRGAGFDRPSSSTSKVPSTESFGHSGFTGTYAWSDPKYQINYVFLSNRVFPDAENWKIVKTGIRTEIQRIIYRALEEAR
jgi:CubicO group peptidase (beta-lactamase class C family)